MSHTKTVYDPPSDGAARAGSTTNPCFEIGITMAGAVSAGAYTAGAVDFLIEALDAWYAAKAADEDVPQHDVSLNVLTGASAGSIVAAILAVCLNYRFPHCRAGTIKLDDDKLTGNPLYDTWVKQIDLLKLLTSHDLGEKQPISSLLDSTCLTELTTDLLNYRAPTPGVMDRRYVSDTLEIIFTINNLRGVPYSVPMMGNHERGHDMTRHAATASSHRYHGRISLT